MKRLFLFLTSIIFISSCEKQEDEHLLRNDSKMNVVSYDYLKESTSSILSQINGQEKQFTQEINDFEFYNFENLIVPDGFSHYQIRIMVPNDRQTQSNMRGNELNDFHSSLDELGFSKEFNESLLSTMAFLESLDSKEIQEVEDYFLNALQIASYSTSLNEEEKFVLTQVYYNSIAIATSSFEIEQNDTFSSGRVYACPENWKVVAKDAVKAGIVGGVYVGVQGARAGAVATLAAGQPLAGGVIGGVIGFTIGFVSAGTIQTGANLVVECFSKDPLKPKLVAKPYTCNGQVYYSTSVSIPIGCTAGCSNLSSQCLDYNQIVNSFMLIPVVPNYGKQTISLKL